MSYVLEIGGQGSCWCAEFVRVVVREGVVEMASINKFGVREHE